MNNFEILDKIPSSACREARSVCENLGAEDRCEAKYSFEETRAL